jgi:hypothetical protein
MQTDLGYEQSPERRALVAAMDAYDGTREARKALLALARVWHRTLPRPR